MKSLVIFLSCCLLLTLTEAQQYIKNAGIKTSLSARNQLQEANKTQNTQEYYVDKYGNNLEQREMVGYNRYGPDFKPAQVYVPEETQNYIVRSTPAPILDPIAKFINETRSKMASGVCFKSVRTSTLVTSSNMNNVIGNDTDPNFSRIQVCCDGYVRNPHIYKKCEPVCKNDCQNGICTAPDTCVCLPGYLADHEGNCQTTCPVGCANGICQLNGECQCKAGYQLEPVHKKYCVPYCKQSCQHGRCMAPNTCACNSGYRADAEGRCEPICEGCDNGECIAPGECRCYEGFKAVNANCEPICQNGCEHGRCMRPNVCECEFGFVLDHSAGKCVPHCDRSCVNGVCSSHNTCLCHTGYARDNIDWSVCNPVCSQGCPQGYCSAPNVCRCNPGFVKSGVKGRHICVSVTQ